MNQPQALIEGDLAFPKPRPFDGLPPPFGSRPRAPRAAAQNAAQREPQPAALTEAQQAIHDAVQRKERPARQSPFPPGVKHILFYKAPPQRSDTHRFDAEMAEAKRYLEMGKIRPRSSRSDYVIGATIFLGCSIALAWLLRAIARKIVYTQWVTNGGCKLLRRSVNSWFCQEPRVVWTTNTSR